MRPCKAFSSASRSLLALLALAPLGCAGDAGEDIVMPPTAVGPPQPPSASGPAASLHAVSGTSQQVFIGGVADSPMVAQAVDAKGRPVPGATVRWTHGESGAGQICARRGEECGNGALELPSDSAGESRAWYRPLAPAGATVTASLVEAAHTPVMYLVDVPGYLVQLARDGCGPGDPASFEAPDGTAEPVTTGWGVAIAMEIRSSGPCRARIKSMIVPHGGTPFETQLDSGERFIWYPDAFGEWVYQDLVSGAVGRIILPAPPPPPVEPGPARIHLATAAGTVLGPVVKGAWPSWSPDGSRLAHHRDGKIYTVRTDGTGERQVTSGWAPAWAPNGRDLAFVNDEGIIVMNLQNGAARTLVRHDFREGMHQEWNAGVSMPAWSPDGSRLAFHHGGDFDMNVAAAYVVNADGTGLRRLTAPLNLHTGEQGPVWSPDGRELAFWTGYGLTLMPSAGGVQRVILSGVYGDRIAWSPAGSSLLFSEQTSSPAWRVDTWVISAGGKGAKILIPDGWLAAWSPDGTRIAFVRQDPPENQRD